MVAKKQERKTTKLMMQNGKKERRCYWMSFQWNSISKFEKPVSVTKSGYGLEIYEGDEKIDAQLYEPVEDGRHIVTMDLSKKIKSADLEKGAVYEVTFDSLKEPLSKKTVEYLKKEKEIEMNTIYQFELKNLELLDIGSTESADVEVE